MPARRRRTAHSRAPERSLALPALHRIGGRVGAAFASGVAGAVAMSVVMGILVWTELSSFTLPSVLGQAFTGDTNAYSWIVGFVWHLINGGLIGLIYAAIFRAIRRSGPAVGALIGLAHWFIAGIALAHLPLTASWENAATPGGSHFLFWGALGLASFWGTLLIHLVYGAVFGQLYLSSVRAEIAWQREEENQNAPAAEPSERRAA